ncbi:MAG: transposase [Methylomicrobium sp.]
MGWFYGFKLHANIHSKGELICFKLTSGNIDDRQPIPELCEGILNQIFADKGHFGKGLIETLARQGI